MNGVSQVLSFHKFEDLFSSKMLILSKYNLITNFPSHDLSSVQVTHLVFYTWPWVQMDQRLSLLQLMRPWGCGSVLPWILLRRRILIKVVIGRDQQAVWRWDRVYADEYINKQWWLLSTSVDNDDDKHSETNPSHSGLTISSMKLWFMWGGQTNPASYVWNFFLTNGLYKTLYYL